MILPGSSSTRVRDNEVTGGKKTTTIDKDRARASDTPYMHSDKNVSFKKRGFCRFAWPLYGNSLMGIREPHQDVVSPPHPSQ